jgi:hypothetical protein
MRADQVPILRNKRPDRVEKLSDKKSLCNGSPAAPGLFSLPLRSLAGKR